MCRGAYRVDCLQQGLAQFVDTQVLLCRRRDWVIAPDKVVTADRVGVQRIEHSRQRRYVVPVEAQHRLALALLEMRDQTRHHGIRMSKMAQVHRQVAPLRIVTERMVGNVLTRLHSFEMQRTMVFHRDRKNENGLVNLAVKLLNDLLRTA